MDIISDMFFVQGKSVSEIGRKIKRHKNVIRSVIGIWRAKDRKGKRNPYEHKLDETKAYKVVEMYMQGGVTQAQVAAAFGCHPAHVSRVINGIMWPSALQRYTDHHALKGAE